MDISNFGFILIWKLSSYTPWVNTVDLGQFIQRRLLLEMLPLSNHMLLVSQSTVIEIDRYFVRIFLARIDVMWWFGWWRVPKRKWGPWRDWIWTKHQRRFSHRYISILLLLSIANIHLFRFEKSNNTSRSKIKFLFQSELVTSEIGCLSRPD